MERCQAACCACNHCGHRHSLQHMEQSETGSLVVEDAFTSAPPDQGHMGVAWSLAP